MGRVSSIYLDYAATTPLDPDVLRAMMPYLGPEFGNPSSIYQQAQAAKAAIEDARQKVAAVFALDPAEIVFTSGATESDNLALSGVAWAAKKAGIERPHIVSTAIEHSAIIESLAWLESVGFAVTLVGCDRDGMIDPADVRREITKDTALISVMYANNEVGSIQPIPEIAAIAHESGTPLHVDATQAAGLLDLSSGTLHADLVSISAHKFYGPKGVGVLAARRDVRIDWQQHGGGQEGGRRGGTENVAGIVGLATALVRADGYRDAYAAHCRSVRDLLWERISGEIDDIWLNGPSLDGPRLPNNLNIGIPGVQGETMLVNLDLAGIAASAGSACSVGRNEPSHVLLAMGRTVEEARSSLRLTVGRPTSEADVIEAADTVVEVAGRVRDLARR
jgi:cysteine desulfurase